MEPESQGCSTLRPDDRTAGRLQEKEISMASQTLHDPAAEAQEVAPRRGAGNRSVFAPSDDGIPFLDDDADFLSVPTSEGLKGAKGALMAMGIEVASVLCFYGIWKLWSM
jgi:hypothetical protein